MNTESVNPIVQKARWIAAKLKTTGRGILSEEEKIFISSLSYRASVQNDQTAQKLIKHLQASHLEFQLTLQAAYEYRV